MKNLILTPTKGLSESEWQDLRRKFVNSGLVGGSDIGTLLGWNKWKSPINLFYQAIGINLLPYKMNVDQAHGKLQEDNIALTWTYHSDNEDEFIHNVQTKTKTRSYKKVAAIIQNPKYPTIYANIDGIITKHPVMGKKKGILEIKKIHGMSVDSYIGGLPPQYLAQIQHYMLVCGFDYGELAMRVDGAKMSVHFIEKDPVLQEAILDAANEHYRRVQDCLECFAANNAQTEDEKLQIASDFEPDIDGSDDAKDFMSEKHKLRLEEITIHGNDEHQAWMDIVEQEKAMVKAAEAKKQLYMNKLKQVMEKERAKIMKLPNGTITWRKQFNYRSND